MRINNTNYKSQLNIELITKAILRACKGHNKKPEVRAMKSNLSNSAKRILESLLNGTWEKRLSYRQLTKINPGNNKVRHIDTPSLETRIYQHLFLEIMEPIYFSKDNKNGLNCKLGCGITAKDKQLSVVKRVKHIFYDCDVNYYLVIDQRKCYEHIKVSVFRKMLKKLISDKWLIDFAVKVCFLNGKLPIGTPTSPLVHHITMLTFDLFIKTLTKHSIRYADDNLLAFRTKEEANQAKWRIKNFWWYELKIRSKKHTTTIQPILKAKDFCGYIYHKNKNKKVSDHNKGYVTLRKNIVHRFLICKSKESCASYYGLLLHGDNYNKIKKFKTVGINIKNLPQNLKLERDDRFFSIESIKPDELINLDIEFTLVDYEILYKTDPITKKETPNYIKCKIAFPDPEQKNITPFTQQGKYKVCFRSLSGNYQLIYNFLLNLENLQGKENILPLKGIRMVSNHGFAFENSLIIKNTEEVDEQEYNLLFGSDSE